MKRNKIPFTNLSLSLEEMEDIGLLLLMQQADRKQIVPEDKIMEELGKVK